MDWEPETIKRVCCEAAITPKDFHDPQNSIWVTSLKQWMDWEPETIKRVCCEAVFTPKDFYDPPA